MERFYGLMGTCFQNLTENIALLMSLQHNKEGNLRDCTSGKQSGPLRELRAIWDPQGRWKSLGDYFLWGRLNAWCLS